MKVRVKVHRVFSSSYSRPRLHGYLHFIEGQLETVRESLRHSCRTEITCQGILLPQDRQGYGRRLLSLIELCSFRVSAPGRRQILYFMSTQQNLVFLRNSRSLLFFYYFNFVSYSKVMKLICRVPSTTLTLPLVHTLQFSMRLVQYDSVSLFYLLKIDSRSFLPFFFASSRIIFIDQINL